MERKGMESQDNLIDELWAGARSVVLTYED